MSHAERPEFDALRELEYAAKQVGDELAMFRRRALKAEAEWSELSQDHDLIGTRARLVQLERENQELRRRVEHARDRVSQLVARLRFLEEQVAAEQATR